MGVTITETEGKTQLVTTRGLVKGVDERQKAPRDGCYVLDNNVFGIRAGDYLPSGAVMVSEEQDGAEDVEVEERAKGKAPQNKAKAAAPENRGA